MLVCCQLLLPELFDFDCPRESPAPQVVSLHIPPRVSASQTMEPHSQLSVGKGSPTQMCALSGFATNRTQVRLLGPGFYSDFKGPHALWECDPEVEIGHNRAINSPRPRKHVSLQNHLHSFWLVLWVL